MDRVRDGLSSLLILLVGIVVALLLVLPKVWGQQLPDVGEQIYTSDDYDNIKSGCVIAYNGGIRQLVCATTIPGSGLGTATTVTLTEGKQTVVTDAEVLPTSEIRCGCEGTTGSSLPSCGLGQWVPRLRITAIDTGSFTLAHSYALGDEQITCFIP